jgi:hypothetical protein
MGELNVYTRKRSELSEEPLWSISGNQGDVWRTSAVTIDEILDFEVNFKFY